MSNLVDNYKWILQSQFYYLKKFSIQVGLESDSVIPVDYSKLPDEFIDAKLIYPSEKCPLPEPWLKVLALLYFYNVPFQLFQATENNSNNFSSLVLLQPSIDQELQKLLGIVAQNKIDELRNYKNLLSHAFSLLQR